MHGTQHHTNQWDATVAHIAEATFDVDFDDLEDDPVPEPTDPAERAAQTRVLVYEVLERHRANHGPRSDVPLAEPFIPGLRPRGHENVLYRDAAAVIRHLPPVDEEDSCAMLAPEQDASEQDSRNQPAGIPAGRPRSATSQRPPRSCGTVVDPLVDPVVDPGLQALREEARHNLHRLQDARGEIAAVTVHNRYQRELRGLILSILNYLEEAHCRPGEAPEFDRWWRVVCDYGRVLVSPEMASKRARTVLDNLLKRRGDGF